MFGLGGIFVEILKDVSFRVVPVNRKDAQEMVKEIKGYPLLQGYRGKEPANVPALAGNHSQSIQLHSMKIPKSKNWN